MGMFPPDNDKLLNSIMRRTSQHFPGGSLNFERFETDNIDECVAFIQELIERSAHINAVSIEEMRKGVKIMATGGGAHKFYELFSEELGVEVHREDEMECLIEGLKFITLIPEEVYYFSDELIQSVSNPLSSHKAKLPATATNGVLERPSPNPPMYAVTFESNPSAQLPCLLVNIGSGVSIIKVDEDGGFERVSGTSLGGGTLWGLLSLLTPATNFDGECPCILMGHLLKDQQRCWRSQKRATMPRSICLSAIFMGKTMDVSGSSLRRLPAPSAKCLRKTAKRSSSPPKTLAGVCFMQ